LFGIPSKLIVISIFRVVAQQRSIEVALEIVSREIQVAHAVICDSQKFVLFPRDVWLTKNSKGED
jgi:hypothetical protein